MNVSVAVLSAPVLFAAREMVTDLLPNVRVAPVVTNPNPAYGLAVTHAGAAAICQAVFDNGVKDAVAAVDGADHKRLL